MEGRINIYNEEALNKINGYLNYIKMIDSDNYINGILNSIKEDINLLEYYFNFINWTFVDKEYIFNNLLKNNTRKKCL